MKTKKLTYKNKYAERPFLVLLYILMIMLLHEANQTGLLIILSVQFVSGKRLIVSWSNEWVRTRLKNDIDLLISDIMSLETACCPAIVLLSVISKKELSHFNHSFPQLRMFIKKMIKYVKKLLCLVRQRSNYYSWNITSPMHVCCVTEHPKNSQNSLLALNHFSDARA